MEETEVLDDDDFYKLHLFRPSKEEAVTHLLPRLLAGAPHGLIRRADVYGAQEPSDLAAEYTPVPSAARTGDRFFFTTCRRGRNGRCARGAGAGTWTVQRTENVYGDAGGDKVGELRHLSFKKGKVSTGWVMEEYRCLLPEAVVADGEMVLCRIHLAQHPPAAARLESDKYKLPQEPEAEPAPAPQPETVTVNASAHARKRPAAPVAAADPPCSKKMRTAVPVPVPAPDEEEEYEDCPVWFTPTAPAAFTEVPAAPEADDDMGRFSCSWEELFGEVQQQQEQTLPVEAENDIEHLVFDEDIDQLDMDELAARVDLESLDLQTLLADDDEEEEEQTVGGMAQEEQALPVEAENKIDQSVAPIYWEVSEELQSLLADHDEEEAQLYRGCYYNAAANLHAPSLGGSNHFFSFGAVNYSRCELDETLSEVNCAVLKDTDQCYVRSSRMLFLLLLSIIF